MPKPIVDEELWKIIEPLLPKKARRQRYPGRLPISDRQALTGTFSVLRTGVPWKMLPQEMGCGSGITCWRRLKSWQEAGVWDQLHQVLLTPGGQPERLVPGTVEETQILFRKERRHVNRHRLRPQERHVLEEAQPATRPEFAVAT